MNRSLFAGPVGEPQTLDEILLWQADVADSLVRLRAALQDAIRTSGHVSERFIGMTEVEVDLWYDACQEELDRLTCLNLVASAEASIRLDFWGRIEQRRKDILSRAYRKWHRSLNGRKKRLPDFFDGGILDVLIQSKHVDRHVVGRFRECLRLRHWIGHGRYWKKPVEVDRFDPADVRDRASALLTALSANMAGLPLAQN